MSNPQVIMYRTADSGNDPSITPAVWEWQDETGTTHAEGSSDTQGLQEALTYSWTHGFDFSLYGGPVTGSGVDASILVLKAPLVMPPWQKGNVDFGANTIQVAGGLPYGIEWDSTMTFNFTWRGGQLVCASDVPIGVLFKPVNELPLDPAGPVIGASRFAFPSIVMTNFTGKAISFDLSQANVSGNQFEFIEPNSGFYGIYVDGAHYFVGNNVKATNIHLQPVGVYVGPHAYGNVWDLQMNPPDGAVGVDIAGSEDTYRIAVTRDEGNPAVGIKLESTSSGNVILAPCLRAAQPVLNLAGRKNKVITSTEPKT